MDEKSIILRETFSKSLRAAMGKDYTSVSLAKALREAGYDFSDQGIRDYLNKKSLPTADKLIWLSMFFNKSMDWFFGRSRETVRPPDLIIDNVPRLRTYGLDKLALQHYLPIPLLQDRVAAGLPAEVTEELIEGWVLIYASREWMPHDPENYTCAHVQGDSMFPVLAPGDIVAVDHADREPQYLNNKMVVFRADGGVTVKWLRYLPEQRLIIGDPENPFRKDATLYLDIDKSYEMIVGRVAWWWAKR